ncbi:hypothetical protein N2152v2_001069 [Parachlorella kessleri]
MASWQGWGGAEGPAQQGEASGPLPKKARLQELLSAGDGTPSLVPSTITTTTMGTRRGSDASGGSDMHQVPTGIELQAAQLLEGALRHALDRQSAQRYESHAPYWAQQPAHQQQQSQHGVSQSAGQAGAAGAVGWSQQQGLEPSSGTALPKPRHPTGFARPGLPHLAPALMQPGNPGRRQLQPGSDPQMQGLQQWLGAVLAAVEARAGVQHDLSCQQQHQQPPALDQLWQAGAALPEGHQPGEPALQQHDFQQAVQRCVGEATCGPPQQQLLQADQRRLQQQQQQQEQRLLRLLQHPGPQSILARRLVERFGRGVPVGAASPLPGATTEQPQPPTVQPAEHGQPASFHNVLQLATLIASLVSSVHNQPSLGGGGSTGSGSGATTGQQQPPPVDPNAPIGPAQLATLLQPPARAKQEPGAPLPAQPMSTEPSQESAATRALVLQPAVPSHTVRAVPAHDTVPAVPSWTEGPLVGPLPEAAQPYLAAPGHPRAAVQPEATPDQMHLRGGAPAAVAPATTWPPPGSAAGAAPAAQGTLPGALRSPPPCRRWEQLQQQPQQQLQLVLARSGWEEGGAPAAAGAAEDVPSAGLDPEIEWLAGGSPQAVLAWLKVQQEQYYGRLHGSGPGELGRGWAEQGRDP